MTTPRQLPVRRTFRLAAAAAALTCLGANAMPLQVNVTIENLAPANGVSFAPLHLGFNNGSFDAFNLGQVANAATISVAEGGVGGAWQAAFAAADPGAVRGTIGGPLFPQASRMASFVVDPAANRFFTFAAMAIPSNDLFIGNDDAMEYQLFDAGGQLQISSITVKAREIWDAGSEVFNPAAAAFVGDNGLRDNQGSVVAFNFAELAAFNGLTTGAGYVFNSQLAADSDVYRISFNVSAVPEPQTYALMLAGLAAVAMLARRRRH